MKKPNYVFDMCMFFFKNDEYSKSIIILFEERESSLILFEQRESSLILFEQRESSLILFGCRSYQVRLMVFNIFTKMSLSNVIWKLKTCSRSSLNSAFRHFKWKM